MSVMGDSLSLSAEGVACKDLTSASKTDGQFEREVCGNLFEGEAMKYHKHERKCKGRQESGKGESSLKQILSNKRDRTAHFKGNYLVCENAAKKDDGQASQVEKLDVRGHLVSDQGHWDNIDTSKENKTIVNNIETDICKLCFCSISAKTGGSSAQSSKYLIAHVVFSTLQEYDSRHSGQQAN